MKNFYLVLILFISTAMSAESTKATWNECIVLFEDGHEERGFIKNFMSVSEAQTYRNYSQGTGGTRVGTTKQKVFDTKFKFKTSEKGKARTIKQKDIKSVKLIGQEETYIFDKVNYQSLNRKGKPTGKKRTTFMLLQGDTGKVNVYVKTFTNQNKLLDSPTYFKNDNDDFAVPYFEIKMNVFTLMNSNKVKNEIYNSIRWVTRDCKEFVRKIDSYEKNGIKDFPEAKIEDPNINTGSELEMKRSVSNAFVRLFDSYQSMCPE